MTIYFLKKDGGFCALVVDNSSISFDSQFNRNNGKPDEDADMWIAYCAFHLGDYKKAMEVGVPLDKTVSLNQCLREAVHKQSRISLLQNFLLSKRIEMFTTFENSSPFLIFQEYERLTKKDKHHPDVWICLACCYFFLGMYQESSKAAGKGETFDAKLLWA